MNDAPAPPMTPLFPETVSATGLWKYAVPLIVALYLAGAIFHASMMLMGTTGYQNAPDEAAHVQYIRSLSHGVMPTQESAKADPAGYEWHQPPLYYAVGVLFLPLGGKGLRGLSIVCGLVTLLVIYRTARLLKPDEPEFAILAMGIAAFTPTHLAITSAVNNDAGLELCCSLALLLLLTAFRNGLNAWRAVWLGIVIGLAILTKVTGLLLIPVAIFGCLLMLYHGETRQTVGRGIGAILASILVVCSWWFVRNQLLYGSPLPLSQFNAAFGGTMQAQTVVDRLGSWGAYWQHCVQMVFQSFWAVFTKTKGETGRDAQLGVPSFLPDQIYLLFAIVVLVVLAGMTKLHFQRKTALNTLQQHYLWCLFAFVGLVGAAFVLFLSKYYQIQGRYLYPAMLPLSFILALGWRAVLPEKYRAMGSGLLLILLGVMSLLLLNYISAAIS